MYGGSFAAYLMCRMAQRSKTEKETTQENVVQELVQKAEAGDAQAQYLLGKYFEPTNAEESWRWNCMAAMQMHRMAQSRMGWMYRWGTELAPKDPVQAYMWYVLAATEEDTRFVNLRNQFARTLKPSQIVAGSARAEEWKPSACVPPA